MSRKNIAGIFVGRGRTFISRLTLAALAFGMMLACGAEGVWAQSALEQTPSKSWVVFHVRNLQDVSQKIGAMADQIQVTKMVPKLADPLGTLLKTIDISAGINKNSDFALALVNVKDYGIKDPELLRDQVAPLALVPVSDYQAFLGNFRNVQTDGGMSSFTLPKNGPKVYCVQWGGYAAISIAKDVLNNKPDGLKLNGACGKEFEGKDLAIYANIAAMAPLAQSGLRDLRKDMDREFSSATTKTAQLPVGLTASQMAIVKVLALRVFDGADRLLEDTQAGCFGVNVEKDGISTSLVYEFKPGSYLAGIVHGIKSDAQPKLTGLPEKPYIFYGASRNDSATMNQLIDDAVNPTLPELQKAGVDTKDLQSMVADLKAFDSATESEVFGMLQPTGQFGKSSIVQTVLITTGDAKAAAAAQVKVVNDETSLLKLLNQGTLTVNPNAKTIDNVQFDAWTVTPPNANTPEAKQMQMMMSIIYGPNGATTECGVVDDKRSITVQGLDDQTISQVISAIRDNKDPLESNDGFKQISKHLPANASGVLYLDLGNLLTSVNDYARQFGVPLGITVQPNLPPIGMSIAADGDALRIDSFTSDDLIQNMVSTGMMMMMNMNQGGAPGGPGGL